MSDPTPNLTQIGKWWNALTSMLGRGGQAQWQRFQDILSVSRTNRQ